MEKAKITCSNKGLEGEQVGPGCFLTLKQISKPEKELYQKSELKFYSDPESCQTKVGTRLKLDLTTYCCSAMGDLESPFCGEITGRKRICFQEPTWTKEDHLTEILKESEETVARHIRLHGKAAAKENSRKPKCPSPYVCIEN